MKKVVSSFDVWAIIALFALVWGLRLLVLPQYPIPASYITDEYCYQFIATTFAEGKLFYPPLPSELHDSLSVINILDTPVRASRCLPAMSIFLLIGLKIFGHMHWGVVLLMALATCSIYWGLRGWINNKTLAFLFALYFLILYRTPHYFIYSYFGGGHALMGTFLVLGSYARIMHQHRYYYSITMAFGLMLLASSRPFEGGVFALCTAICMAYTIYRNRHSYPKTIFIKKAVLPFCMVFAPFVVLNLFYNKAITGSYLTLPYILHAQQREVARVFWFLPFNEAARSTHWPTAAWQLWGSQPAFYDRISATFFFVPLILSNIWGFSFFKNEYISINIIAPYLLGVFLLRHIIRHCVSYITFSILVMLICNSFITWVNVEHYFIITGMLVVVHYVGVIEKSLLWQNKKWQSILCGVLLILPWWQPVRRIPDREMIPLSIINALPSNRQHIIFIDQRAAYQKYPTEIASTLAKNAPNLQQSNIILAWYISPEQNQRLIKAYPQRQLWYWRPDFKYQNDIQPGVFQEYTPYK